MLIPKQALKFVDKIVSKEPSRYAINCALIEPNEDEVNVVATDGKKLAVLTWTPDALSEQPADFPEIKGMDVTKHLEESIMLYYEDVKEILTAMPKKSTKPILQNFVALSANGDVEIQVGTHNLRNSKVLNLRRGEGVYPKWRDIMPTGNIACKQRFNIKFLIETLRSLVDADFDLVDVSMFEDKETCMQLDGIAEDGSNLKLKAILMPVAGG